MATKKKKKTNKNQQVANSKNSRVVANSTATRKKTTTTKKAKQSSSYSTPVSEYRKRTNTTTKKNTTTQKKTTTSQKATAPKTAQKQVSTSKNSRVQDVAPYKKRQTSEYSAVNNRAVSAKKLTPTTTTSRVNNVVTNSKNSRVQDIAPVKEKKKDDGRTWFKKSEVFDDGYQFGDVTKAILGSGTDLLQHAGTGIIGMGEKALDAFAMMSPGMYTANQVRMGMQAPDLELYKEMQTEMDKFVEKDLYDEQKVARNILEGVGVDVQKQEANSVFGEKSDALAQSAGQLGATALLQATVGVPWFLTMGSTAFGSEAENALNQGATHEEAMYSALISSGAEILSERISGGISFGGKTLDNALLDPLVRRISDKTLRTLTRFGINAGGEGFEEIFASVFSRLGSKLYKDESVSQLLLSEEAMDEYLESFIGGAVLGGGSSVTHVGKANKAGKDFATGLSENELKVVQKEIESREKEALDKKVAKNKRKKIDPEIRKEIDKMKERFGENLTEEQMIEIRENVKKRMQTSEEDSSDAKLGYFEKNRISNEAMKAMERGEIDVFTINDTLFRDNVMRMRELDRELETATPERKAEIEAEKAVLKDAFNKEIGKSKLLQESYNQERLKGEKLDYKLSDKASDKAKKIVQSAMEAGENNTRVAHEKIDFAIKVAENSDVEIEFVNDEQLEIMGHYKDVADLRRQLREAETDAERDAIQKQIDDVRAKRKYKVNGFMQEGTNKILLNINSKNAVEKIVGHEVTHIAENTGNYKNFRKLIEDYAKEIGDYGHRINNQGILYKRNDSKTTSEKINQEVVADLVGEYVFSDEAFVRNLSMNEQTTFEKTRDYIKHIFKMATTGSQEARQLEKAKRMFDKVYRETAKANKTATENTVVDEQTTQTLKEAEMEYDSKTKTVSYSLASLEDAFNYNKGEAEYQKTREDYVQALMKSIGDTTEEGRRKAESYLDSMFLVHDMIARDQDRLDYKSAEGKSAWVGNVEYGGSIDFSTLCAKRRLFTGTFDAIQNALPDTVLTDADYLQIRNLLLEHDQEAPCSMCYVEGSRAKHGTYVKKFLNDYLKTNPEWKPQIADFASTTRLEQTRIQHPEAYAEYVKAMNKLSQRKPKEASVRTDYKGEILKAFKDGESVEQKNLNGGVRFNSFSDFEIIHTLDAMQVITDMSRVGLNGQAYTKVKEFAECFGETGLKINLSLVAKDVDADGNLVYDEVNGMKHSEAIDLRNKYSDNVGTVIVVFNEAQLKSALANPEIDYVLPFHRSQWRKSQYTMMGLPTQTKDFTNVQNDRFKNPKTGRPKKVADGNIMPNEYWDFTKTGRENAQIYLDYINEHNYIPKFDSVLEKVDGKYALPEGAVGDGYFKLLIDFKMYNNEGVGIPQSPVIPKFNMDYIPKMLDDYKGGHHSFPVANDVVEDFLKYKKGEKDIAPVKSETKYSLTEDSDGRQLSAEQQEYFKDSKMRDNHGNLKVMYHGSENSGFTVFDSKFSDDGRSLFFTDSPTVAKGYSGTRSTFAPKKMTSVEEANAEIERDWYYDKYRIEEEDGEYVLYEEFDEMERSSSLDDLFNSYKEGYGRESSPKNHQVYLNLNNPLVVDAKNNNWYNLDKVSDVNKKIYDTLCARKLQDGTFEYRYWDERDNQISGKMSDQEFKKTFGTKFFEEVSKNDSGFDSVREKLVINSETGEEVPTTTREYSEYAKENGYDGVIFNNIIDAGQYASGSERFMPATVAIAFDSNQIKSVNNTQPTSNPDIRYSMSEDSLDEDHDFDAWLDDLDIDDLFDLLINGDTITGVDSTTDIAPMREEVQKPKTRAKRRVDEVNNRLKEIGLSFNGTKSASWTDERIDKYLSGSYYGSSNPNYAQAYITYMTPKQFLNLTVGGNIDTMNMIENESAEYGEVDFEKLGNSIPVQLSIKEGKNGAEVTGHEGRHRMYLLGKAGFEKIPVLMFDHRTKYDKSYKDSLKLKVQRYNDTDFISNTRNTVVNDVVPFSQGNRDMIIQKFGSGNQTSDVRYSMSEDNSSQDDYAPMTEAEANERDAMQNNLWSLNENDMPQEVESPYGETQMEEANPFYERDIKEVGKRNVKAYMYENPEVKPFFQEEAKIMLRELRDSTKGERTFNSQLYYDTGGEQGWFATKRQTSEHIAYFLDEFNYTYADVEKGLKAIIEDHGAENNAISKRIEFMLDERLREGYTDFTSGYDIPNNPDYVALLENKQITEYNDEAYNRYLESLADIAPTTSEQKQATWDQATWEQAMPKQATDDIAPVSSEQAEPVDFSSTVRKDNPYKPNLDELQKETDSLKPKSNPFDDGTAENQEISKIIDTVPKTESQRNKRKMAIAIANVFDKGAVFEKLAIMLKNRNLIGKWNYTLYSEARAQRLIGNGNQKASVKSLNSIREAVESSGLSKEFQDFMYHRHNVDRMRLEERYGTPNKAVFGDSMTAEMSQQRVDSYLKAHPEFGEWAEDVYGYMNHLRNELVDKGVIAKDTAKLWQEMYPHYVPIKRVENTDFDIEMPTDTNSTGVNAPIQRATGGSSDILPLFNTMAERTLQTYKASAKNSFGVELKNALAGKTRITPTDIDGVIEGIEAQENLLQEGKNGARPTFTVFENGEKVTFEITEDMYDALKPLSDSSFLSKTIPFIGPASQIHRGLLTEYNPVFMFTNGIKDIQDVLLNSQHVRKTYAKVPEAWMQILKKGYWYNEYMENGGEQNSYFNNEDMFDTERKGASKILDFYPIKAISRMNNFIEMTPRLAEYIASREAGRSIEVSMLDAARVTTNFRAGGDFTKWANRNGATFLNASVQGAMQQVRNVREANMNGLKGWANLATKFLVAGVPTFLLNNMLWDDDEEYEELADYVKQNYYVIGKYGEGKFIRIPKGRAVAVIQDAFEQTNNAITGDDEVDLANFLKLVAENIAPNNPLDNNVVAPVVQAVRNKTWYGEDLVPSRLQDMPAREQYDESTDSLSRWISEKSPVDISPMKINYLLNQYSGGIGDVALPMLTPEAESGDDSLVGNLLATWKDKFTTDSVMNNQNVSDFYELSDELKVNANSMNASEEDQLKSEYISSIGWEMSKLYQEKRDIQNSDSLTDKEKYSQVREIQREIDALAEKGVSNYEDIDKGTWHASVGDKEFRWYQNEEEGISEWREISEEQLEKQNKAMDLLDISAEDYWTVNDSGDAKYVYDWAVDNPEYYQVSRAISDDIFTYWKHNNHMWNNIRADKDENGKSISGTKKTKIIDYINSIDDLEYEEKIVLFKKYYPADDTYNNEIIDYLNSRDDISYEEMETILKQLEFKVDSKGNISW